MTSTSNQNPLRELKLHSPAGIEPAIFTWPNIEQQKTNKDAVFIGGDEIVRTIRLVFEDYPQLYQQNLGLATCDIHSYSHMKELCDKFNKIIDTHIKLNRGTEAFSARLQQRPSSKLFRHILAQVYSRAVTDPDKLRDYEPFSPSVYGETSPDLIDSMLKLIEMNEDQTFIDLGSGVGNVVLHVAALANCKHVYGIEHEETPSMYARAMGDEFRSWMRWYGKRYSDFELERGDFLTHPTIDERIREADVIFVNNYVFGSTVNHELKVKFMNMKDGARIVSSREFCPETFRLNDRTKNDLGAVMHVTKPEALFGKVSWSDKSVQYYLHVIDHSKLALYYEKIHQMHSKGTKISQTKSIDDDRSLSPLSNNSSTTNGKTHRPVKATIPIKGRKNDGEENDSSRAKINSLKRPNSVSSVSGRGRKIRRKLHPDKINFDEENPSELESDLSNDGMRNPKQSCASSKDYHSTLNELHHAAEEYFQSHENQRFNYPKMTKLTDENLRLNHFRDCLIEQEDQDFFQSINKYLDRFRQRLFSYFTYMKSNEYREHLKQQLNNEKELNKTLKAKVNCLEANIKILLEDAIDLLKVRTNELGVEKLERPAQLINYANDISSKHKELRSKVASLEQEIAEYDHENEKLASILTNMEKNGYSSFSSDLHSASDNTYSTLLASMSRQTQQQEMKKSNELSVQINQNKSSQYETDSKADFIIEKRVKKCSEQRSNPPTLVSPIRIVKVNSTGKRSTDTPIALRIVHTSSTSGINNLLSSKQLEPVQVHSVISTANQYLQTSPVVQSINVKSLLSTPSTSKLSSMLKDEEFAHAMMIRSPRKKRDFYGKSPGPTISSTASSPSNHRSHRYGTSSSSPVAQKTRPSSTPACTTTTISTSSMPDRPTSIPPLRTSS